MRAASRASGLRRRAPRVETISHAGASSRRKRCLCARRTPHVTRHTFPSAIVVNTNPGPRSCALQILAPCLPGGSAPVARHSSSRPIANSSPAGRRMRAFRRPTISGNPPANICRHPHFGRCHCPTVSLRLTTGHRGRMASEQAGKPAIPSRNQHMPTQFIDTASAYDGVRRVR